MNLELSTFNFEHPATETEPPANAIISATTAISMLNGLVELDNQNWPNGLYILEVLVDEIPAGSVKLVVTE